MEDKTNRLAIEYQLRFLLFLRAVEAQGIHHKDRNATMVWKRQIFRNLTSRLASIRACSIIYDP